MTSLTKQIRELFIENLKSCYGDANAEKIVNAEGFDEEIEDLIGRFNVEMDLALEDIPYSLDVDLEEDE